MNARRLGALAALACLTDVSVASACGGFFCNNQAIDQSGEDILFVWNDDGTVTTVVQIRYEGPSEQFAWILPVPAEPTVSLGTDALFTRLGMATRPRFTLTRQTVGECRAIPTCPSPPVVDAAGFPVDAGAAFDASLPGGVDVSFRGNVGPYDVAVLSATDTGVLQTWLEDNGYLLPASATAELDHYVALGHTFVALRLQKNRSTGEIQPIALRSTNPEPCIPIRLTRIATQPDMPITAYFLGAQRSRPMNYLLIEPDLEERGLWPGADTSVSYDAVVTAAVDAAGGHAFVTDFAGPTPSLVVTLPSIEDLRAETDPVFFLRALQARGFVGDSQLLAILTVHLPPPPEYDPQTFYNCVLQGWCGSDVDSYVAGLAFEPSLLVDALNEQIVTPRQDAQALLDSQPHLTRLYTTMSAEEMTLDPTFVQTTELPAAYANVHEATLRTECSQLYFLDTAPQTFVFPSGATQLEREGRPSTETDAQYCARLGLGGADAGSAGGDGGSSGPDDDSDGGSVCAATPGRGGGSAGLALLLVGLGAAAWRVRRR